MDAVALALGVRGLLGPSAVVAVVVTALLLWVLHRRALRGRFVPRPAPRVSDPTLLRVAAIVLVIMLALLVSGLAPWMPTTLGALVLIAVFAWRSPRRLSLDRALAAGPVRCGVVPGAHGRARTGESPMPCCGPRLTA